MLNKMLNDVVTLVKKDGSKYENIKAHVSKDTIIIMDEQLPIEEGDNIHRDLSSGLTECYLILDRNFKNVNSGSFKPHYQCKVKKEGTISIEQDLNQQKIYKITGENSRININSTDNSTNVVNKTADEIFKEIRKIVNENIDNNEEIIKAINEMEQNKNKKSFMNSYQKFISSMSNHMNLIAPFIPALSQLFT